MLSISILSDSQGKFWPTAADYVQTSLYVLSKRGSLTVLIVSDFHTNVFKVHKESLNKPAEPAE